MVGASGSGKSTLADLLLGFWQPTRGTISVGGVPFDELSEETLRAHIGVVEQNTYLFNATLRENLLLAQPKADEEALWQALAQADVYKRQAAPVRKKSWTVIISARPAIQSTNRGKRSTAV